MSTLLSPQLEKKLFKLLANNELKHAISSLEYARKTYQMEPSLGLFKIALTKSIELGHPLAIQNLVNNYIMHGKYHHSNDIDLQHFYPKLGYAVLNSTKGDYVFTKNLINKYKKTFLEDESNKLYTDPHVHYLMAVLQVENFCKATIVQLEENKTFQELWKVYLKAVDQHFDFDNSASSKILSVKDFPLLGKMIQMAPLTLIHKLMFGKLYIRVRNINSVRLLMSLALQSPTFSYAQKTDLLEKFKTKFQYHASIIDYEEPLKIMKALETNIQHINSTKKNSQVSNAHKTKQEPLTWEDLESRKELPLAKGLADILTV